MFGESHRHCCHLTLKMSHDGQQALSLSAGKANSFICLIEIQAKNVFFRVFASAIGEIFVFSDDSKTAFLQHSYRPDVVRCRPGENRPIYNKVEHPIERLSR